MLAYLAHLCVARGLAAATVLLEEESEPALRTFVRTQVERLHPIFAGLRPRFPDVSGFPRPFWETEVIHAFISSWRGCGR